MNKKKFTLSLITTAAILPISFSLACSQEVQTTNGASNFTLSQQQDIISLKVGEKPNDFFGLEHSLTPKNIALWDIEEYQTRKETGVPFENSILYKDVVNWEAGKYSDDEFMRSNVPLRQREYTNEKINSTQREKNFNWLFEPTVPHQGSYIATGERYKYKNSQTPGHGTEEADDGLPKNRGLTDWSYINNIITWNSRGSKSGGKYMELPPRWLTENAHRNGVRSLGTIFYMSVTNDESNTYDSLMNLDTGSTENALQLARMADYYGFDGYFLNLESFNNYTLVDKDFVEKMKKWVSVLYEEGHKRNSEFTLDIYGYGMGSRFFTDIDDVTNVMNDKYSYTYNFPSWANKPKEFRENANLFWEFAISGFNGIGNSGAVMNSALENDWNIEYFSRGAYRGPIGVGIDEESQLKFFSSDNEYKDPRIIAGTKKSSFIPVSQMVQEQTTLIGRKPWSTSFNNGKGMKYFNNGEEVALSQEYTQYGFRDQSLQDLMPTYRYINDIFLTSDKSFLIPLTPPGETKINTSLVSIGDEEGNIKPGGNLRHPEFTGDWVPNTNAINKTAYNGSSVINFNGKMEKDKTLTNRTFASNNLIENNDKFEIVMNTNGSDGDYDLLVWLKGETNPTRIKSEKSLDINNNKSIQKRIYNLDQLDGKTVSSWGFAYDNKSSITIDLDLMSMSFIPHSNVDKNPHYINPNLSTLNASSIFQTDYYTGNSDSKYMRLGWETNSEETNDLINRYEIYVTNSKYQNGKLVDISSIPNAYLKEIGNSINGKYHFLIKGFDEYYKEIINQKIEVNE